ncbi:glycerophosphodiester phosphodiesterase [Shewanella yunxiaonensis]|uniref:Glycerophosphodiester phosphodiesterase n=1 Tax=Shewanella yunxiaonensis TaxID=2829809 RepID=A0ABX7YRN3_9GAMM|nr:MULTISPECIES: glycerophosphodiester phosphodiesterase [Shewanella]MDF0534077.1 glycerophosphodiester phosphodiesterase [Shewanella sp. A32]QUN05397.1 glycerophosphodiester phosphodiesterase [Shewanella yunxiaonensis]
MLVFAHRGASGYAPENTIKAMLLALELGADAVELDVHSVEGELLVFHDRQLAHKSSGSGLIHRKSLQEVAELRVGGEVIPTLRQVLQALDHRLQVNIELKGIGCVAPFLKQYPSYLSELGYQPEQLLISSFNHPYLRQVKQQFGQAHVAPLLASIPEDLAACASTLDAVALHLDINFISHQLLADAHQRGLKVHVYTVDDIDDIRALKQLGVDGIFSNFPDKARQVLAEPSTRDYSDWFE